MTVLPLNRKVRQYLVDHQLERAFNKQVTLLEQNIRYPGLKVELLEPKYLRIYSFRVNRQYRALFIFRDSQTVEIISVTNHYKK